jgi:hypothetical protein
MAKTELKTQKNKASVQEFIAAIKDPERRSDAKAVLQLMQAATREKPVMWGTAMVGFGQFRYKRRDGSEHNFFMTGFSPRKDNLTIYSMSHFQQYGALMKKLGKYKLGTGCLYIRHLSDINLPVLKALIAQGYKDMKKKSKSSMIFY